MNSGCYNNDISKVLISIQAIDLNKFSEINIEKRRYKIFVQRLKFT